MDELASRKYPVREHMGFQRRLWTIERIGWLGCTGKADTGENH